MRPAWGIAIIGGAVAVTAAFLTVAKREAVAQAQPAPSYQIVTIPQYERGPRIIHVPQPGDERASVDSRYDPAVVEDDDVNEPPPPPKPRRAAPKETIKSRVEAAPKLQRRSDMPPPPPPGPQRTILSAPPPSLADGPTPIRPTPRYTVNNSGEKFAPPREPSLTASEPAEDDSR